MDLFQHLGNFNIQEVEYFEISRLLIHDFIQTAGTTPWLLMIGTTCCVKSGFVAIDLYTVSVRYQERWINGLGLMI